MKEGSDVASRMGQAARSGLFVMTVAFLGLLSPLAALAAPYAAMVMDARTGEVLHAHNAETRLHPASLTKMMTLYIAFQAVQRGEVTLDTEFTVSRNAANEVPSKLGLRAGQKIRLRYLIRAAAVKSANDAATAIGEGISGSEAAFAARMNATARAMGMTNTNFRNMHGLTENGHYSTAHDMTILGRHIIYDFPQYYNVFARRTADAGIAQVAHTNRRFLDSYPGADGIKTGYTSAAGFNLVASAERGQERIIATVFGGNSTASRNAKVAELMDLGFARAPDRANIRRPAAPGYHPGGGTGAEPLLLARTQSAQPVAAGKTIRVTGLIERSLRPMPRPVAAAPNLVLVSSDIVQDIVAQAVEAAASAPVPPEATVETAPVALAVADPAPLPEPVAEGTTLALAQTATATASDAAASPVADAVELALAAAATAPALPSVTPRARPAALVMAAATPAPIAPAGSVAAALPDTAPEQRQTAEPEVVTRISTSGGRHWGVNIGRYGSRHEAERMLLQVALSEISTLDGALRRVTQGSSGFDANFMGLSRDGADLACRRLQARGTSCFMIGPDS